MGYSVDEVMQYVREEDVKFIRLAFCDVGGTQKNVSIMPYELERAFKYGISIDASAVRGFGGVVNSDLFLVPDPATLAILPWRPDHGRVVRMFCNIRRPDGSEFECDTRSLLIKAARYAKEEGYSLNFGTEYEFYLFKADENGNSTGETYDNAGYMDIAPDDKGENVRREICFSLERMGIIPEASHHEEGPGQNEIDFRFSDPLTAADNAVTFRSVVRTIASRNGLYADFSPKPLSSHPGNGLHINISASSSDGRDITGGFIAGIIENITGMTLFLNPVEDSYRRLGCGKSPKYITWSPENRSQLIRIPAAEDIYRRFELRSPDPSANPYLAFALLIYAGIDGVKNGIPLPEPADIDLFSADASILEKYKTLPATLKDARRAAYESTFIKSHIPEKLLASF